MLRFKLHYLVITCIVLALCGCSSSDKEARAGSAAKTDAAPVDSLIVELKGEAGKSVFEITQRDHAVDFIPSIAGNFVEAIDSIEINGNYGWMYSVNDTMGQVASDKYLTNDGDIIKWHFRKF